MGDAPFHWKPLGKRWNGSLIGAAPFHWKPLGKRWNGNLVGMSQFHWKPLGKQWNGRIYTSQCHQCISSLHIWNYIYEITYMKLHIYEMNNVIGQWNCSPFHWKPLGKQWNGCFLHAQFHSPNQQLHIWNYIYENYIYEINDVMADEISLKTLSKTMKWTMLHLIENPEGNNEMEASSVLLHWQLHLPITLMRQVASLM